MERSAWTDERLDDLAASLDTNVRFLREEMQSLRRDVREDNAALRSDFNALRTDFRDLRSDLSAWQRQIARIGWALVAAMLVAGVALLVASL